MTTGDKQNGNGQFEIRVCQKIGIQMPEEMVDSDEWFLKRECEPFGDGQSYEESANEPGTVSGTEHIYVLHSETGFTKSLVQKREDVLKMLPCGYLGDNTAILAMYLYLGRNNVRNEPAVFHNGDGSLITRTLYCKYSHVRLFL